jgi:ABC-type nickel/cobalt efflux system permease component RcnA
LPAISQAGRERHVISVLLLGLVLGMKHAMEADHVAAVASLAARSGTVGEAARLGVAWGMGHTLTLFVIGAVVLLLGAAVPETATHALEFAVGVVLVGLGIDVVRRMMKEGVHVHAHQHHGERHLHLHQHDKAAAPPVQHAPHSATPHAHPHKRILPLRALCVGLVHGMAGSAALIVLTLGTIQSVWLGVAYIGLFGIGSIAGMLVLSLVIGLPLRLTAHKLGNLYNGLTAAIGVLTIFLGASIMWKIGVTDGLFF